MRKIDTAYERILLGREQRYQLETEILDKYRLPILVATVNYPGLQKNDETASYIFGTLLNRLEEMEFLHTFQDSNDAGPYFIGIFMDNPMEIKKKAVKNEEKHPLGRLFDIDVIGYPYHKISRANMQKRPRICLVCKDNYVSCMREKKHTTEDLLETIKSMVEVYGHETADQ
jgi:holo-ACP synthase